MRHYALLFFLSVNQNCLSKPQLVVYISGSLENLKGFTPLQLSFVFVVPIRFHFVAFRVDQRVYVKKVLSLSLTLCSLCLFSILGR